MIRLAFASGKGGTGKTLLSTSAAWLLAEQGLDVRYVDADVEAPNGHLFLHPAVPSADRSSVPVPEAVPDRCTGCGACQEACAFHAILAVGSDVLVFPELCHSCGLCVDVCPEGALVEVQREIGELRSGMAGSLAFTGGLLDVGEARATPLVEATVRAAGTPEVVVVDCPPGTSCPAMAAVEGADLVVLVTEPTPFGLHDLDLAVRMCRALGLEVVVVLNRADLGGQEVQRYLEEQGIPLLGEVPFDRDIAASYASGEVVAQRSAAVREALEAVLARVHSPDHGGAP